MDAQILQRRCACEPRTEAQRDRCRVVGHTVSGLDRASISEAGKCTPRGDISEGPLPAADKIHSKLLVLLHDGVFSRHASRLRGMRATRDVAGTEHSTSVRVKSMLVSRTFVSSVRTRSIYECYFVS